MSVKSMAAKDAAAWAYAEMFFGEGAGTRRKLLEATIATRVERITGYHEAFSKAYEQQDFAKLAIKAARERQRLDSSNYLAKNIRALVRGDVRHVSPALLAVVAGGYFAHKQGYDKVVLQRVKVEYRMARNAFDRWRKTSESPLANVFYTEQDSKQRDFDIDNPFGK